MSQIKVNSIVPVGGLPSGSNGGIIQVVNVAKTDTFTTTSTSPVDVTGMAATITPSSNSNKILVTVCCPTLSASGANGTYVNLLRGSTAIAVTTVGSGNLHDRSGWLGGAGGGISDNERKMTGGTISFLDSPATTSATTYKIQLSSSNSSYTSYFNRWGENIDNSCVSTITLMEVST